MDILPKLEPSEFRGLERALSCVYHRKIDTETIFIAVTLQFYQEA